MALSKNLKIKSSISNNTVWFNYFVWIEYPQNSCAHRCKVVLILDGVHIETETKKRTDLFWMRVPWFPVTISVEDTVSNCSIIKHMAAPIRKLQFDLEKISMNRMTRAFCVIEALSTRQIIKLIWGNLLLFATTFRNRRSNI